MVTLFFAYTYNKFNGVQVERAGINIVLGIGVTHLLRYFIITNDWLKRSFDRVWGILLAAVMVASLVYSALIEGIYMLLNLLGQHYIPFYKRIMLGSLDYLPLLMLWVLIYYVWHIVDNNRKQQLESLRLESLVKELELKTIKSHINPHFIFNALNSIRALVDENPGRARTAITELSNILRSSMQTEKMETVPLEKELAIVRDYLALEKIRFEERLKVEMDIDEDTLEEPVPVMMLQTLVENAIKHGISKRMQGGVIRIRSYFKGDRHELVVQNTGHLNGQAREEGFGIMSTLSRLSILYGPKANFEIRDLQEDTVEAKISIPVETL
ncbi:histidine kinase [Dinghuibacter silviterrae]|uniref:Histidine kinase n=2 Tax=Dinghuibacter silviterrae TaxID=1539049 RepID=A0A4R8DN16_9BACT|nr:histidine kinase [Dinghuibacter silviterrae]